MLVSELYEVVEGCLYSVQWDEEERDSLNQFVAMMDDNKRLREYLKSNSNYLFSGYYHHTIDTAMDQIREEYEELLEEMIRRAENGPYETQDCLERLFQPLDDRKILMNYKKAKAKPHDTSRPILRVYGYKMHPNCVVVSGYGIKLTHQMSEHPDLDKELKKLNALERYIDENRIVF